MVEIEQFEQFRRSTAVVVPFRSGSRRLIDKNVRALNGKRLFEWSIEFGNHVLPGSSIFVSTDYLEVRNAVTFGSNVEIISRPPELALSQSTTESVLTHVIDEVARPEIRQLLVLQPTSPLRSVATFHTLVKRALEDDNNNVFTSRTDSKSPNGNMYLPRVDNVLRGSKLSGGEAIGVGPTHGWEDCDIDYLPDFMAAEEIANKQPEGLFLPQSFAS